MMFAIAGKSGSGSGDTPNLDMYSQALDHSWARAPFIFSTVTHVQFRCTDLWGFLDVALHLVEGCYICWGE